MIAFRKPRPNDIARRLTGRDYLSFSAISTFQSCPLRYYFRYIKGLPEETVSSNLVFGGAVHAAAEFHFRELMAGNSAPDLDTLLAAFWESWHNRADCVDIRFARGTDVSSIGHLADRVLETFARSDIARPNGQIIGVEEELRGAFVEGCPDLLARIDLIVATDDELVVSDLKTARSRWRAGQANDSPEQLLIYSQLAQRLEPRKSLRLDYTVITKSKTPVIERYPVTPDSHRLARTQRIVERVWQAIQAGSFYPSPSPINCRTCAYRGPCRQWN